MQVCLLIRAKAGYYSKTRASNTAANNPAYASNFRLMGKKTHLALKPYKNGIFGPASAIGTFWTCPPYVGVSNFLGGDQFPIPTRYKISVWGGPVPPPHVKFPAWGGTSPPPHAHVCCPRMTQQIG